ncbi:MAG: thioredoxin domain-containing protein, partial [Bradymonadaceae bacterium]
MTDHEHTNALIDETSPYLLQHAHNPVDWHPWGEEALDKARADDKPIFLSIGYSACHWCHVMERESFEDEEIAAYLNEHFVPIKVDREERPDLDRIYMNATQMLTGQGGWPMSVFLTPDLEPFYAGTYFPPEDKYGRPGFRTVLEHLVDLWDDERDRIDRIGDQLSERLEQVATGDEERQPLDEMPLNNALSSWNRRFDDSHGGFGKAPKFPPSMQLRALLGQTRREGVSETDRDRAREIVESTLVPMASGGMYDQIGGGFHRYSVDEHWLVPHFEKMLYDNAMLTLAYVDAYRETGREFHRRIVDETLGYVTREMTHEAEEGTPFYSSQDAESEGEEGKFFVWTPESLREVLTDREAERAEEYWGITEAGNFENEWSIPNRLHVLDEGGLEAAFEEIPDEVAEIRQKLFDAREERIHPGTDTKVLASWNGLMIRAFAHAGFHLDEPDYIDRAAG